MHVKTSSTPTSFPTVTVSSFQRNIRAIYTRKNDANCTIYTSMSYLIRLVLAKPRLILDEMSRLYGKFASYLRRILCKTRLIFPRINGPIISFTGGGAGIWGLHTIATILDSQPAVNTDVNKTKEGVFYVNRSSSMVKPTTKMYNLISVCNIAAKRFEQRCCAFYIYQSRIKPVLQQIRQLQKVEVFLLFNHGPKGKLVLQ